LSCWAFFFAASCFVLLHFGTVTVPKLCRTETGWAVGEVALAQCSKKKIVRQLDADQKTQYLATVVGLIADCRQHCVGVKGTQNFKLGLVGSSET
jgi:hypothetical protein